MANIVKLPQYQWGDAPREVEYHLPDSWDVTTYDIAGAKRPVMTPEQVKAAVASPIGSPRLRELARGKKQVVIIFDDMSRGTQVSRIVPAVLEELAAGGIEDEQIEFICAGGTHQPWDRRTLAKKLGDDIICRFPVFAHVTFMNCTPLGRTKYGSRVEVNTEVMSCDLKIAIGRISTHNSNGFSGGGKIVMPGISSYDAIAEHHAVTHQAFRQQRKQAGFINNRGFAEGNPLTLDCLEHAKMAGIDFLIDVLQNVWGEPVAVFAGALEPTYFAGVREGKEHFWVTVPGDNDVIISNAFTSANEATAAFLGAFPHLKASGGDIVLVANTELGHIVHFMTGHYGKTIAGRLHNEVGIPPHVKHLIIYSEWPEKRYLYSFRHEDWPRIQLMKNWTDVVMALQQWHPGQPKVAAFVDGIQQITMPPS
ncbi:MAG: DUF2088 domain-containing protein [Chloroflexi bacterium]|nr:DUF2088 domain-containing protein [Chloroflexota bacterium]